MKIELDRMFLTSLGIWAGSLFGAAKIATWPAWAAFFLINCLLAAHVILKDDLLRARITSFLAKPDYHPLYLRILKPVADWPRDWRCYDWALRIALAYPMYSIVLIWAATGQEGRIGSVLMLPASNNLLTRGAALAGVILPPVLVAFARWRRRKVQLAHRVAATGSPIDPDLGLLSIVAVFAMAGAVAYVGDFELVTSKIGAMIFGVFGSVGVAIVLLEREYVGAFTYAVGLQCSLVAVMAVTWNPNSLALLQGPLAIYFAISLRKRIPLRLRNRSYLGFTLFALLVVIYALAFLPWSALNDRATSLFLFFCVLPIVNAVFDYLSYMITLLLIRIGIKTGGLAFAFGLADLVAALLLFTVLGAVLVLVIAAVNVLAGVPLFPLAPLFAGLEADPANYLWLYATLFSTILPTIAHLTVVSFSLLILPFAALVRLPLGAWINGDSVASAFFGPIALALIGALSAALPFAFLYALYLGLSAVWPTVAADYLAVFEGVAVWAGELPAAAP